MTSVSLVLEDDLGYVYLQPATCNLLLIMHPLAKERELHHRQPQDNQE